MLTGSSFILYYIHALNQSYLFIRNSKGFSQQIQQRLRLQRNKIIETFVNLEENILESV